MSLWKIQRLIRPEALAKDEPLFWSPGKGADVWEMFCASIAGDLATTRRLLDHDPSLARASFEYRTALSFAVREDQLEVAACLLEHGADPINSGTPDTLLQIARDRGFAEMQKILEDAITGVRGASPNGEAIAAAIRERDLPQVRTMLDRSPGLVHAIDERTNQPIHDLLYSYGAAGSVQILAHDGDVRTAAAVFAANAALADDPDALASAAQNGHDGFVRLMLRYQPDLPTRTAVAANTRDLTEVLFRHGMDPNRSNWLRVTPLHRVAEQGDLEKAAIFLDHGADLHARDEEFRSTPLAYAAKYGKTLMVEYLLRRGAKPTLPDDPPWATPLAWARRRGHEQVVTLLEQFEKDGSLPSHTSGQDLPVGMTDTERIVLPTQQGYDRWSEIYDDEDNPLVLLEEPHMDAWLSEVRGLSVLDVGCGTGRHAIRLADRGAQVTGVDFSAGMLRKARQKAGAERVTVVEHDIVRPLPFDPESFDCVVSCLVLDHVVDLTAFFADVRRVCRKSGFVVVSVMHPAMELKGVQARFRDAASGTEIRPASASHQISDYVMGALDGGLHLVEMSEYLVDAALASQSERARKYLGWPMLLLMKFQPEGTHGDKESIGAGPPTRPRGTV